jgi:hypothetical protein
MRSTRYRSSMRPRIAPTARPLRLLRSRAIALCIPIALFARVISGCRNSPPEPAVISRPVAASAPAAAAYRPLPAESARRIAALVADGGAPVAHDRVLRIDLPTPPSVDIVAVHVPPDRWVVGAVERDRVTVGLEGAERVFNLLNASNEAPSPVTLARIIGAMHYYPWRVFDGSSWSQTGVTTATLGPGSTPMLTSRPNATGRVLTFSYWIPEGTPGAGLHLTHIRVTDSGYLIDEAPHPDRR